MTESDCFSDDIDHWCTVKKGELHRTFFGNFSDKFLEVHTWEEMVIRLFIDHFID